MTIPEPTSYVALTADFVRNKYFESFDGRRQADRTQIECLMMNAAQRQSVRNLIRAARRVAFPTEYLRVKPNGSMQKGRRSFMTFGRMPA